MAVTCQHCGSEAPDDRVMCPNCRRRMRPAGEQAPPPEPAESTPEPEAAADTTAAVEAAQPAAASPWETPGAPTGQPPRPQVLFARNSIVKASRLTVLFRWLLVIPHVFVLFFLQIAFFFMGLVGWFAALFTGRLPDGIHDFMSGVVRYQTRVGGYNSLLTDTYPPFALSAESRYPVEYETSHENLNRVAVLFRYILAIPAHFLLFFVSLGFGIIQFFGWFVVLITGRVPESFFDASAGLVRYQTRVNSYYWLLTPAYPAGLFREQAPDTGTAPPDDSTPQPPRQGAGAKRLLVSSLVLGAGGLAALIVAVVVLVGNSVHDLNALRTAHNKVVHEDQSIPRCGSETADQFSCLRRVATIEEAAFRDFDRDLSKLHLSTSAAVEKQQLLIDTRALVAAWHQIATAPSAVRLQQLVQGDQLLNLQQRWNDDYKVLDTAVAGS
jgi:hypothetical protein